MEAKLFKIQDFFFFFTAQTKPTVGKVLLSFAHF